MARSAARDRPPSTDREGQAARERRKAAVLSETAPSKTSSIAEAGMLKDLGLYLVCTRDGGIPTAAGHGLGIYHRDCRYVCGYEVRLAGQQPQALATSLERGWRGVFQLVNMELRELHGVVVAPFELAVQLVRALDGEQLTVVDDFEVHNYASRDLALPVRISLDARFEDLFTVRGQAGDTDGVVSGPTLTDGALVWNYEGIDGLRRGVRVVLPDGASVCPAEDGDEATVAEIEFEIDVPASSHARVRLEFQLEDEWSGIREHRPSSRTHCQPPGDDDMGRSERERHVECDLPSLQRCLGQAFRDIDMLSAEWDGRRFVMAGMPWFATLFGRDSAIAALQLLPFDHDLAADTARVLAHHQGTTRDEWRDEEPGKILHELRRDELTNCGALPYSPYYGSIDATPLFLMLVAEHARQSGSLDLLRELRDNVDAALDLLARRVDSRDDGLIAYDSELAEQMIQKGWRDSRDGVVTTDGSIVRSPVALVEVQAYACAAWQGIADALERDEGNDRRVAELRERASRLRQTVHDRFRSDRLDGSFAIAIHGEDAQRSDVATSNPGHALWCGIADEDTARCVARRLLADDLFSGWGVRTLGSNEAAFNPVSYHRGSVWPHDNAIVAAGLRRYGFDAESMRVCQGILDAAHHFESFRLPELFSGHGRADFPRPVRYPVACHPQAWAAGSLPMILRVLTGFEADGFGRRARFVRPLLPVGVDRMTLRGLRVADGRLDVHLERYDLDRPQARVHVLDSSDEIDVDVEAG